MNFPPKKIFFCFCVIGILIHSSHRGKRRNSRKIFGLIKTAFSFLEIFLKKDYLDIKTQKPAA